MSRDCGHADAVVAQLRQAAREGQLADERAVVDRRVRNGLEALADGDLGGAHDEFANATAVIDGARNTDLQDTTDNSEGDL